MQRAKFDPHNGHKIPGEKAHPCSSPTEEVERRIPETQWSSSLDNLMSSRPMRSCMSKEVDSVPNDNT